MVTAIAPHLPDLRGLSICTPMATAQATAQTGRTAWARNLARARPRLPEHRDRQRGRPARWRRSPRWCGPTRRGRTPTSRSGRRELSIRLGDWASRCDLRDWVNDGPDDVLLPRRRPRGQARARPGRAARAQAPRAAGRRRRSAAWSCRSPIYLAFNAGGAGAPRLGRRDVDRHRVRARRCSRWSRRAARRGCACSCSRSRSSTTSARCSSSPRPTPTTSRSRALAVAIGLFGVLVALRYAPVGWRRRGRRRARRRAVGRAVRVGRRPDRSPASPSAWSRAPTRRRAATSSGPPSAPRSFREQPTPELARAAQLGARPPRSRPTSGCSTACTRGRAT